MAKYPIELYASRIQVPDGTILQSFFRHDYKEYTDTITGETYMLDGGTDYVRTFDNEVPPKDLSVYTNDPHEVKRLVPVWGTSGKDGKQPLKFISVSEMDDDHIEALLDERMYVRRSIKDALLDEVKYRKNSLLPEEPAV